MSTYVLARLGPRKLDAIREKAGDIVTRYEGVGVPSVRLLGLAPGKTITDVWIASGLDNVGQLWGGDFETCQEAYIAARKWLKTQCVRCLGVRPAFGGLCHACADRILFIEEFDSYSHELLADYVTAMREHVAREGKASS